MAEARYNLIFEGKVDDGKGLDEARGTLESLFDFHTENQRDIFDGQAIILGRNMDSMTANSFKQALAHDGIIAQLFAHTDTVAEESDKCKRAGQRRQNTARRARVRGAAIVPDRRQAHRRED